MKIVSAELRALYLCLIVISTLPCCNNPKKTVQYAATIKQLKQLLVQKEYFKLQTQFNLYAGNLEDKDRLYFRAFIDNAFNRNAECIKDVDSLLITSPGNLPDSLKSALRRLQGDSYFKIGQYEKAALNDSIILKGYKKSLSKDEIDDTKNDLTRVTALKDVPPQQIIAKSNTAIPWHKDKIGLIEIPIMANRETFDAVFDTRANISSITQTYARKLGLQILNTNYNESSGATGLVSKTGIAIADSLRIGDIIARHVVFEVMPDSIFFIASIKFQLNIILGLPLIQQLQEVDLYKAGRMVIPINPAKSDLHNLAFDKLDPILSLKFGSDTLSFDFDSGAVATDLYAAFFERYKNQVLKKAVKQFAEFGGAGGSKKKKVYVMPSLILTIGNQNARIDSAAIQTEKMYPGRSFTEMLDRIL